MLEVDQSIVKVEEVDAHFDQERAPDIFPGEEE
jgi:hypothetical protein